ncbi:MAG: TetR family transcriptional regulator [Actinomycetota bacterium]
MTDREQRIDQIRRAAIPVFATQGFKRTSMADLAAAAGVSRPALYQYFDNRADLFREALQIILVEATDAALAALEGGGSVADRIDGYLQRLGADGYETLYGMEFAMEFLEAKHEFAADVSEAELERGRDGLRAFIADQTQATPATRAAALELVLLSPAGLKAGWPEPAVYRARLTTLADATALLLDA